MGYLRGVSCAQRLALPMGLNGPFLSLYVYIYIYSVYRDTCALGRRNIRRTKRKGKKTADWKRRSLLRFCAAQSLHGGFLATPRDFSYLSTQLISGKRLVYWYQVAYNTSSPPGPRLIEYRDFYLEIEYRQDPSRIYLSIVHSNPCVKLILPPLP